MSAPATQDSARKTRVEWWVLAVLTAIETLAIVAIWVRR